MTRSVTFAPDEFYHIYNRGTEKRNIFLDTKDYDRFLTLLYLCNGVNAVDLKLQGSTLYEVKNIKQTGKFVNICSYCLMTNHFHLILQEVVEGGISKFMQKLVTAYTMYFNKKYDRSGALFQGKFKAIHADDDRYLAYLIAYIHLNPVEIIDATWKESGIRDIQKAKLFLERYTRSSFLDYCGKVRLENLLINKNALPQYFESTKDFESSMTEWLNYNTLSKIQGSTL